MIHQIAQVRRFEVRPTAESHFSWIRTRLALERTLMSWVRTAVSLIGFGFAIVQFFEWLHSMTDVTPPLHPQAHRYLGLALIAAGVVSLLISVFQYWAVLRYMRSRDFAPIAGLGKMVGPTPLYAVSIALIGIGVFAFAAVLTRAV